MNRIQISANSRHAGPAMLAYLVFAAAILFASFAAAADRPNIVLIVSDDHAWTDYGFAGHKNVATPNLDKLAAQSLTFTRGYVPASLCCPSLASIITGRYPHEHKIANNDPPVPAGMPRGQFQQSEAFRAGRAKMNSLLESQSTLPKLLTAAGYLTLQTGKWWQGHYRHGGFTHGMTLGEDSKSGRHGDDGLRIGRQTMQPIYDFIATAKKEEKPFFVWYAPMMPHDPHTPPERILAKYRDKTPSIHVARYWAMVEWFDETCGQLLEHLEKQGLAENTIVAYVTADGWIDDPTVAKYAPRSKQSPYDGGLRTPIMVRWPGKIAPAKLEMPVSSLDLLPTLLSTAEIKPPTSLPGIDLRDAAALKKRDAIFGECFAHDAVDLDNPAKSLRFRYIVAGKWKLIVPAALEPKAKIELFDIEADPLEQKNLAEESPDRVRELRERLDAWWSPPQA